MLIRFNEISPLGNRYRIQDLAGLDDQPDFMVNGPLDIECVLRRMGESKVELTGHLAANLTVVCDRCLAEYPLAVRTEVQLLFEVVAASAWHVKEVEFSPDDLDCVLLDEPIIDLDDILRQQVYLALPMKKLCYEQCRGICGQCGANRNQAPCTCSDTKKDSPFAILERKRNI